MTNKTTPPPRWLMPLLATLVVALGGLLYWLSTTSPADDQASGSGRALVGGPFTLTDHNGRQVSDTDFRGRYMLVFFGYTYCPDVCPVELQTMSEALNQLPARVLDKVQPLFITTDPERDTVEIMNKYVSLFHPKLIGLTGSEEQVRAAARAYRVYYQKVDDEISGAYLMDHSAIIFVMDPKGDYVAHFSPGVTPDAMAERLLQLAG